MARVISFINLKGGVGKTTLVVTTAEILAYAHKKRVLVIDLDPQTNATVSLISQERWKEANDNNNTIHQLFLDKVDKTNAFNIKKSIIKDVGNIGNGINGLDLLPSSIDLVDMYDIIPSIENASFILKDEVEKISCDYDYILIDCPPNLCAITMSGIYISQYYIIPVIADTLSTYGLKQVVNKIDKKVREIKRIDTNYSISKMGVVINRYRDNKPYNSIKRALEIQSNKNEIPRLFKTIINNKSNISKISDYEMKESTIKQKYGKDYNLVNNFVKEIMERCQ
ncbi:hypothetical protein FHH43_09010 [Clostridium perfringens]|nr:hypothetical protein [Clostridium perfringens]